MNSSSVFLLSISFNTSHCDSDAVLVDHQCFPVRSRCVFALPPRNLDEEAHTASTTAPPVRVKSHGKAKTFQDTCVAFLAAQTVTEVRGLKAGNLSLLRCQGKSLKVACARSESVPDVSNF